MASELQRVAQGLVECLDQMPQVVAYLQRLAQKCRDNAMHIADFHSAQPAARNAALMLDEAARRCDEAAELAARTPQVARVWAAQMVGGTAASAPGHGSTSPPARTPTSAGRRTLSTAEVVARGRRLPLRKQEPGHRSKTHGIWVSLSGRDHSLVSGVDEYTTQVHEFAVRHGLVAGRDPRGKFAITTHVEAKFAMMMRERNLSSECIVVNNPPCQRRDSCDTLLPELLPGGASLTVYGPGGYMKTYYGKADR